MSEAIWWDTYLVFCNVDALKLVVVDKGVSFSLVWSLFMLLINDQKMIIQELKYINI